MSFRGGLDKGFYGTALTSFFGSPRESSKYRTPLGQLDEVQSNRHENSKSDIQSIKVKITNQKATKPEVTISEYEINKKWYEYEQKQGKEKKWNSVLLNKTSYSPEKAKPQFSLNEHMNILGNLKVPKKPSGTLNPLITPNAVTMRNTTYDSKMFKMEELKTGRAKPTKATLLSIKQYEAPNQSILPMKCCE